MENNKSPKGGAFITNMPAAADVFTPEDFNEEQRMIAQTCQDFLDTEVFPNLDRLDAMEPGLMRSVMEKTGEMGLLGITVPEEYSGFGQDFTTGMIASEVLGAGYSYAVAFSAHTGIGTLPILYYGNEDQKQRYIPKLATGEWMASYCLTEPGAGSDANSGKTKATLSECGKYYILNGGKMWITNGGFADVHTVFAKIDNDRVLSAFIVERTYPGVVLNVEEKKMGIKGSSTVQIFYNDVKVPVENLLGKRGEGFRIALEILHIGRIKLGGNVLGSQKRTTTQSVNYANERKQFGVFISSFGAIKHKMAEQAIRTYATESAVYRVSNFIDQYIQMAMASGSSKTEATKEALSEYAIEAAVLKVIGSESLDYIVDEAVQIFGGMGYSAEAPVDRAYRDSRINRIFEGTNEINRLVIVDTMMKKAMKGDFDLFGNASATSKEMMDGGFKLQTEFSSYFEEQKYYITNLKKAVMLVIGTGTDTLGKTLLKEQEIMFNIADCLVNIFTAESILLRIEKKETKDGVTATLYRDISDVFLYEAASHVLKSCTDAINSFAQGAQVHKLVDGVWQLTRVAPLNVKDARRRIADKMNDENKYCF
jgi:alkylation response protein AidB-like acyl-CoA dehydrogenase